MGRFIAVLTAITLGAVVVSAQDAAYQQGLSLHNQQIQQHLRAEQEQQRQTNQFGGSFPQQQYQPQYQQPAPQQYNNQYSNSNNYARSNNAEQEYQEGLKRHQEQLQAHIAKEAQFQPHHNLVGAANPAYQQGLQLHQRQIQEHLAQEQQHGGPAYQAPQSYHQAAPAQTPGLQAHMQQLLDHQRREQQHQAQVGHATQYHASHYSPPESNNNNNNYYQPPQQSYQPRRNSFQNGGKVTLASLGF